MKVCTNMLTDSFFMFSIQFEIIYVYYNIFFSVSDVVRMATKAEIPPHKKMLDLIPSFGEDEDDDSDSFLTIRYLL